MTPTSPGLGELILSRRRLLAAFSGVGLAALAGELTACRSGSDSVGIDGDSPPSSTPATIPPGGDPSTPREQEAALLRRFTFGVTPGLARSVSRSGVDAWLDAQLAASAPEPEPFGPLLADMTRRFEALDVRSDPPAARRAAIASVTLRTIGLAAWSPNQVREVLTNVFSDLLHVSLSEQPEVFLVPSYDTLIRSRALTSYRELLAASARHPAMLAYLDQATSRADAGRRPNENYARELLELHTVGVDGGYTEETVLAVAHVLSGWSVERGTREFTFRPRWHDLGPARNADILGWTPRGDGEADGASLLDHLARHEATARRVVTRLARRLVDPTAGPTHPAVADGVAAYRAHDTSISEVVRALSAHARRQPVVGPALRTPQELLAAAIRLGGMTPSGPEVEGLAEPLARALALLGHLPYQWPGPDGYPDEPAYWTTPGAMIARWNALETLVVADLPGVERSGDATSGVDLARRVLGTEPSAALTDALTAADRRGADPDISAVLVFASPDFQLR